MGPGVRLRLPPGPSIPTLEINDNDSRGIHRITISIPRSNWLYKFAASVAGKSDYTFFIESGSGFCGDKEALQSLFQQHFHTLSGGIFFLASFISAVIAIVLQPILDAYVLIAATGTVCIATLIFVSFFPILSYTEKAYTKNKYESMKEKIPKLERQQIAEQAAINNGTNGGK